MKKITYASDAQGVVYAGRRVIARDNPENPQSAADIAGLVFRANIAADMLEALESANCPVWVHNAAITNDIEALRRIALWYSHFWNNQAMPALAKAKGE